MDFETLKPYLIKAGWGALTGAVAAARVDYLAFKASTGPDWVLTYSWGVAAYRWFQGAVAGAAFAVGLDVVT